MDPRGPQLFDASILPFPQVPNKVDERLLTTILDNMSQAVLLFDSEARLVICNQRYIEMYRLSQEFTKSGCTLRELIDRRVQAGTFSGDPEITLPG